MSSSEVLNDIKNNIVNGNIEVEKTTSTSYVVGLSKIPDKKIIMKQLNYSKIQKIFQSDYCLNVVNYYNCLKQSVDCVNLYDIYICNDFIYEIQEMIESETLLENKNVFTWQQLLCLYQKIMDYISKIKKYNEIHKKQIIGIDTSIWNFNINGKFFDFSPPRIIEKYGDPLFTRSGDQGHYKRTFYRNFDYLGMKVNLTVTLLKLIKTKEIEVLDIKEDYIDQIINILYSNINNSEKDYVRTCLFSDFNNYDFEKHPLELLKRMVKYERN